MSVAYELLPWLRQCEECGEPYCSRHGTHYSECPCPGVDDLESGMGESAQDRT